MTPQLPGVPEETTTTRVSKMANQEPRTMMMTKVTTS
jgi:hypothetical protein